MFYAHRKECVKTKMNESPEKKERTPSQPSDRKPDMTRTGKAVIPDEAGGDGEVKKKSPKSSDANNPFIGTIIGAVKGIVYITVVIVTGVALAFFFVIPVGNDIFALVKDEEVIDVTIPEMATLNDVADIFYENGLISYPGIFKIYCEFTENKNSDFYGVYLAGDYSLSTTLNYSQLLEALKPSSEVTVVSVTIPEGMTTDAIINLFVDEYGIGTKEGFVEAINNYDWGEDYNYWFINELEQTGWSEDRFYRLDGYLFPDTYFFYSDATEVEVISKLLDNFDSKFEESYRNYVASVGMTVDEAITLASMIQTEAKYLSEYALVSSVFHNRLDHADSYPTLESDATIMYAMEHNLGSRPETLTGTEYDSPYNTYKHNGLPPGPICNPGYNAIIYAIYPRSTNYYYFVANNDGYSVFSETKSEHDQAIEDVRNGVAISTLFQGGSGDDEDDEDYDDEE